MLVWQAEEKEEIVEQSQPFTIAFPGFGGFSVAEYCSQNHILVPFLASASVAQPDRILLQQQHAL